MMTTPTIAAKRSTAGRALAALLATTLATPSPAQDTSEVAQGYALTRMYCADCHAVAAAGESPLPEAPRFRDLQYRYQVELLSEALVEGLVTAHPEMPEFEFDPGQAQAIIAYLKTLE